MKAVGLTRYLPVTDPECFVDVELPIPVPAPRDILVKVEAISVNPVDCKQRAPKAKVESPARVLGWDAAGTVHQIGSAVALFKPGDRVYYAGDVTRAGCDSEYHVVDERIASCMPATLDFAQAAALPLTSITAWEALFDRLKVAAPPRARPQKSVLIIGGAGGVGSIAIQIAAKVAGLKVIATASRPESVKWCRDLGASEVVSHFGDLVANMGAIGIRQVDYVLVFNDLDHHFKAAAELLAPQGGICSIVRPTAPLATAPLMSKSSMIAWEFMFTRPSQGTPDMIEQHHLLNEVARLVDQGVLRTTLNETLAPINAANLRRVHAQVEAGRTIGKVVLSGWG